MQNIPEWHTDLETRAISACSQAAGFFLWAAY